MLLNKSEDGSGPGQGTSAGYEVTQPTELINQVAP